MDKIHKQTITIAGLSQPQGKVSHYDTVLESRETIEIKLHGE